MYIEKEPVDLEVADLSSKGKPVSHSLIQINLISLILIAKIIMTCLGFFFLWPEFYTFAVSDTDHNGNWTTRTITNSDYNKLGPLILGDLK